MKKIVKASLVGMLIIYMFTAVGCQPTPDEEIVKQKNDGELLEIIEESAEPDYLYEAPSTYTNTLESIDGVFKVDINATVTIPQNNLIPVIRVAPAQMTQEMAEGFITAFFGDNPLYKPRTHADRTKEEIEEEIARLQIGDTDLGRKDKKAYDEMVAPEIERLKIQYKDAPDTYIPVKVEGTFTKVVYDEFSYMDKNIRKLLSGDNIEQIDIEAESLSGGQARLTIERSSDNRGIFEYYQLREGEEMFAGASIAMPIDEVNPNSLPEISLDDAKRLAQEMVDNLGLEDFQIADYGVAFSGAYAPLDVSYEDYPKCYVIYFTKDYGYLVNFTSNEVKPELSKAWENEVCRVYVDNFGVARVVYESPTKVLEYLSDSVELLPFDEIIKKFEDQILIAGASFQEQGQPEYHLLKIEKIKLGLCRIKENEDFSQCLYVPAWDFYGKWSKKFKDEEEFTDRELGYSYLTINALDGSIINRESGY